MRRKPTVENNAIHTVALNHGLPDKAISDVVESVFKMVKTTIESSDRENCIFLNIHLINLGKLYVSEKRKVFLRELNKELSRRNESVSNG